MIIYEKMPYGIEGKPYGTTFRYSKRIYTKDSVIQLRNKTRYQESWILGEDDMNFYLTYDERVTNAKLMKDSEALAIKKRVQR
ncbi:hypothetical protein KKF82_05300 [Patescibacteria group bacterium]|nr:hypothetical protein [Patescibacteria group bacterium]